MYVLFCAQLKKKKLKMSYTHVMTPPTYELVEGINTLDRLGETDFVGLRATLQCLVVFMVEHEAFYPLQKHNASIIMGDQAQLSKYLES